MIVFAYESEPAEDGVWRGTGWGPMFAEIIRNNIYGRLLAGCGRIWE